MPDPALREPTDAVVRVARSCICGSELWPYGSRSATEYGDRIAHEFLGAAEDVGAAVSGLRSVDLVVAPILRHSPTIRRYPQRELSRAIRTTNSTTSSGRPPWRRPVGGYVQRRATRADARAAVFAYLNYYNRHRLHSTLKLRTPHEARVCYRPPTALAA